MTDDSVSSYSANRAVVRTVLHRVTRRALLSCVRVALRDFFMHQFLVKIGIRKQAVLHVDHALDFKIPFSPCKIDVYLDFLSFCARAVDAVEKTAGKKGFEIAAKFIDALKVLYAGAGAFYKKRLTTTFRPKSVQHRGFFVIHALDPHFMCVPSLHVAIVFTTFAFFRKAFADCGLADDLQKKYSEELFAGAVGITESVLYVKQHSVNCIPAALFMAISLFPDLASPSDATDFIDVLFAGSGDIGDGEKAEIREHIAFQFERFVLERQFSESWQEPVIRWLDDYEPYEAGEDEMAAWQGSFFEKPAEVQNVVEKRQI